jgi:ubiquinone/menaquinone biosynthesis C-methylase UbiE
MAFIKQQFGKPTGWLGHVVGWILAYENRERNEWAVAQLDVQPNDHILEIGFGPGLAIEQAARLAVNGLVAGVDYSDVMLAQASARNKAAIQQGRVDLKLASAESLAFPDGAFDKVFAVNALHISSDPAAAFHEIHRVLKPGGFLAAIEQPRSAVSDAQIEALVSGYQSQMSAAGFGRFRVTRKPMRPAATICVIGYT